MSRSSALVRIRFPLDVVERLDAIAAKLGAELNRTIPRAAVIRALILIHADAAETGEIMVILGMDPVKRGRKPPLPKKRRFGGARL